MLTETGLQIKRLPEILASIAAGQKVIFPALNLDPSTPDGQLNGIFAELIVSSYELALKIYNGLDPRTAEKIMLDRVCAFNGIKRLEEASTIVDVTFTGAESTLIEAGSAVSASSIPDVLFYTVADVTIGIGYTTAMVEVEASKTGPVIVPALAIDTLNTPIAGVTSVSNLLEGITGRKTETDPQLRIRREKSVAILSNSLIDSIYSRIASINGVSDVRVYHNNTTAIDSLGIDPHSVWIIVKGGIDSDIANAIMTTISLGAGTTGSETVAWIDSVGYPHDVKFGRSSETDIFVDVSIVSPNYNSAFGVEIKQKIVDYVAALRAGSVSPTGGKFSIADVVYASALYPAIVGSSDYTISEILIGLSSPGTLQSIALTADQIAAFDVANISITVL
jgi:uncharacterized phage protein gp47/JayE